MAWSVDTGCADWDYLPFNVRKDELRRTMAWVL